LDGFCPFSFSGGFFGFSTLKSTSTGIIVTNDVGSGGTFTIRGYSDASKTIQLFEWSADLTTGADDWNSTQFPQPRPLGRAEALNVTAEVASGSGHGVDVWIEYIDMDVVV